MTETITYGLAIDYGSSFTAAAVRSSNQSELLSLSVADQQQFRVPSLVWVDEDGELVAGWAAERGAALAPERLERSPKQFLGEEPMQLGRVVTAEEAVGATLALVLAAAEHRFEGQPPAMVQLTHPASWSNSRKSALRGAARAAGLGEVTLVDEPIAAARHLGATLTPGQTVAVYDLGGGTFDCAVLRRRADEGFDTLAVGGQERLGGETFDARLVRHLGEVLAKSDPEDAERVRASSRARAALRREARAAKESLSLAGTHDVVLPEVCERASLRLTRDELERLVEPDVRRSVDILLETVSAAGLGPGAIDAVYLTGGSSRMPIVGRLLAEVFGAVPATRDDPKAVVVLGALSDAPAPPAEPEPDEEAGSSAASAAPAPTRTRPRGDGRAARREAQRSTGSRTLAWHLRWAAPLLVLVLVGLALLLSGGSSNPDDKASDLVGGLPSKWSCRSENVDGAEAARLCRSPDLGGEVVLSVYASDDDLDRAYDSRAKGKSCESKYPEGDAIGDIDFEVFCIDGSRRPRVLRRQNGDRVMIEIKDRESQFGNLPLPEAREFASLL